MTAVCRLLLTHDREVHHDRSSSGDKAKSGYSKAVDLWSLGCVTVVLLTGGGAFVDPATGTYSEQLAHACNMSFLRDSSDWQQVRARPKSFVDGLLVLDEEKRMAAHQALHHEWFSNEVHKTNFEELYQRTIKHWRPRPQRRDIVEFRDASFVQSLMFPRRNTSEPDTRDPRPKIPVDAHYKPVPKKMYSDIWPKKSKANSFALGEIQAAIRRWPSQWKNRALFDDDDDDEEEEELKAQKTKRRDLLNPSPAGCKSRLGRGQRSYSAPPCLAPWSYPPKRQSSNVGRTRSPLTVSNLALIRLQSPGTTVKRSPVAIDGRQSPLRESTILRDIDAINADAQATRAEATTPAWTPAEVDLTLAVRGRTNSTLPKPHGQQPATPEPDQSSKLDMSRQASDEEVSSAATTVPTMMLSTPVRTDRLKRWLTSPIQETTGSRSSSKRRRGSVFEIEEDDDMEMSPTHGRAVKRTKHVQTLHDTHDRSDDDENSAHDDEITLPHHPVSLRSPAPTTKRSGLYLPR